MDGEKEFIILIEKNKALIYKVAGFYTDQLQDREDLSQEIVYQLWKSVGSFRHQSNISTWIYRVAMNTAIHFLKKRKRWATGSIREEMLEYPATDSGELEEQWKMLQAGIGGLDLLERGIVMLWLEGKSYEEISDLIGISAGNVGTRLSRIREKLKKKMTKNQ
jgi:RNA polymerase sigma-70 factor (ECF subfamily)